MERETLGELIKRLREERGFTIAKRLADRAHVSRSWLSRVEKGIIKRPAVDLLDQIARALRMDANVLRAKAGYALLPEGEEAAHAEFLRQAEEILGKTLVFLREGEQPSKTLPEDLVLVPLIGHIVAGEPDMIVRDHEPVLALILTDAMRDWLAREIARPQALIVVGDSMSPILQPDDRVIIDPDATPRPGQIVAAQIAGETTVKIYLRTDEATILRSTHPDRYPDIQMRSEQMGTIQGVVRLRVPPPPQVEIIDTA